MAQRPAPGEPTRLQADTMAAPFSDALAPESVPVTPAPPPPELPELP